MINYYKADNGDFILQNDTKEKNVSEWFRENENYDLSYTKFIHIMAYVEQTNSKEFTEGELIQETIDVVLNTNISKLI